MFIAILSLSFQLKYIFFLRSTRLMIRTFDFRLPLQYSQSTTYFLLALIPVKSRLFPPRISTKVSKLISYQSIHELIYQTTNPIFFFFSPQKALTGSKKKSWEFSFGSVWIGWWINSVSKIWVTWKMYDLEI